MLAFVMFGIGARAAYGDWTNVWSDEFNGTNIDLTKWTFDIGNGSDGWGNNELEYYTSRTNNAYVTNGVLHIRAQLENTNGFHYTSARMKTQGLFWQQYGWIEFRASLPQGVGFWPALWMLGTNITSVGWPECGEIDVMESNGTWSNKVQGTINYSNGSCDDVDQTIVYTLPTPGDSVTNFHTYGVQWFTNSIVWLVDGVSVQTWTSWSSCTGPYPAPYNQPFFLIMNLAVGGNYLGDPSTNSINPYMPGEMLVDYVRVYDFVPPSSPPATPTGLSATPGSGLIWLSWSASSNATSYIVGRATTSGGPYTIIGNPASTSYSDTGVVNCTTYYYVVAATNTLGQSANSSEASATLGSYAIAVNSGGSAAGEFIADANVTGGTVAAPTASAINTALVTNPAPQAVYQTERYGTFTYTFAGLSTGTSYIVRLHLAEIYWTGPGEREFNVSINGTQVLSNYDIFAAAGGEDIAIVPEFTAAANGSGQIIIAYTVGTADQPKSSGIEIILPAPAAPTGLMATAGNAQVALSWSGVAGASGYNVKRATTNGGPYTTVTNGLTGTIYSDSDLVDGTTYYYVVSALENLCESANSAQVSATPLTPFAQWQMQYFGCTNCPQAQAGADPLGKGIINTNQFLLGLNPTNPASVFRITSVVQTNGGYLITWKAAGVRTNVVQGAVGDGNGGYSNNFSDISPWIIIPVVGNTVTNYTDPSGTNEYYRIRLGP